MTDVEELLRETLSDPQRRIEPGPRMYETVRVRACKRRRRQSAAIAASLAVVAIATAGSVVGVQRGGHRPAPASATHLTPATSPALGTLGAKVSYGTTWEQATAVTIAPSGAIYVLTTNPTQVVLLAPTANESDGKYDVKGIEPGPSGLSSGMVVGSNTVWAYSADSGEIREYDARTLAPLGVIQLGAAQIFQATALADELWFTGSVDGKSGLHRLTAGSTKPTLIPGVDASAYGVAADPARNRILVGVSSDAASFAGTRVESVDASTLKIEKGGTAAVGKESIAVVYDDVWLAGYGSGDSPRVVHFDAASLQPIGTTAFNDQVGPGAEVVAGMNNVWVQAGGDAWAACLDPSSGRVLEIWENGFDRLPASAGGEALGIVGGEVTHLNLAGGCFG
ncbi:MAG: hypothetical protein ACRDV3_00195 [Acidothermaceae bacterium]